MQHNTYLGQLDVRIGEYDNTVCYLIVANSESAAEAVLNDAAANYYGDGSAPFEDGGYYANHGEVHVRATGLHPIGLTSFLELKAHLPVRYADNATVPAVEELSDVKHAAVRLQQALAARNESIGLSTLQHALAASWGQKNWQVLKAKVSAAVITPDFAGCEGWEFWAVTCRMFGDDDDSLYLVWGNSDMGPVDRAKRQLWVDSGYELPLPEDKHANVSLQQFVIASERIGIVTGGQFQLDASQRPVSD
jgi:hypothetical protein